MSNDYLYVCTADRVKQCNLLDHSVNRARNIQESYRANEITTLSFDIPVVPNGKWVHIQNEQLIFYNNEYYIIKKPTFYHDEDGKLYLNVECRHLSDILANSIISTEEVTPMNIVDLMKMALLYDEQGVSQTGWTVGKVEVDKVAKRGLEAFEESSFSILLTIAEKYNAIMIFDSVNMQVNVKPVSSTTRPNIDLRVSKNLKSVEISYDTSEMYTRLYCYGGEDEDGNELDIITVNPTGKPYIDNYEYFERIGYSKEFIEQHQQYFTRTNLWRDSAYFDPQDLYDDGVKELAKIAVPIVDIKVTALDTTAFGVSNALTNLQVGDCIRVYDEDIGLDTLCNVTSRDINHEEPHLLNIEVTNSITYHDTLSQLFKDVSTMGTVGGSGGNGGWQGNITVDDIVDLNLYYLTAEQIEATYASIGYLQANYITANEIRTNYLDAVSIAAQYATIGSLEALEAKIGDLDVDYINGKLAEFEQLFADNAEFHKVIANQGEFEELKAGTVTITGMLKAANAQIENLEANKISTGEFEAYKATIEQLFATYATIEYLEANYLKAQQIEATYAKIGSLEAVEATIETLNVSLANIETLVAQKADIKDLNAIEATIGTINADLARINEIIADTITTGDLEAEIAKINQLIAQQIEAVNAKITALDAKFATIEQLNAAVANIETLIAKKANIEDLNAAKADIGELDALVANINTILSGSIGTGILQTVHLTAQNVVIDDALIKSAMIDSLDVSKLNAGVISTDKFQVQSNDGGFRIVGNTTQWTDSTGRVRMQAGRDASGNFNFAIFGEDGTTSIFDENGIHEAGIPDGIIRDDMIADDANISGSKIERESLIEKINEDGTKTISSSKIWIDEENQSLGAKFDQITTDLGEKVEQGDIDEAIDNIKIGAVNLIRNAKTMVYSQYGIKGAMEYYSTLTDNEGNVLTDNNGNRLIG